MVKGPWAGVPVLSRTSHLKLVENGMMLVMGKASWGCVNSPHPPWGSLATLTTPRKPPTESVFSNFAKAPFAKRKLASVWWPGSLKAGEEKLSHQLHEIAASIWPAVAHQLES